jgi:hypothetical protein
LATTVTIEHRDAVNFTTAQCRDWRPLTVNVVFIQRNGPTGNAAPILISRLERRLHAVTNNARGTQYSSATIRRRTVN